MNHSIEVQIHVLNDPETESYDEIPLEVTFDIYGNDSEITGYFLDGKPVKLKQFYDLNPSLNKLIDKKIDGYINNYEPLFMDCE